MKIEINKDFGSEYKDEFWKGFSGGETACILIAAGVAVGVVAFCHFKFHISPGTAVYLGVPAAIPILVFGFFRYQGNSSIITLVRNIYETWQMRRLTMEMMAPSHRKGFCMRREKEK